MTSQCKHRFVYPSDDFKSETLTGVCKLCGVRQESIAWCGFEAIPSIERYRRQQADRIKNRGEYAALSLFKAT